MHPDYARSLAEFGIPSPLPRSGGWILRRRIPGCPDEDGMGCYPLFACRDWSLLPADLENLRGDLVALSLVADPFGQFDVAQLRACFDVVIPYKSHFVVDLQESPDRIVSKHHRYEARRALRQINVERCADPGEFLDEWVRLYANLIEKHHVTGIRAFSRAVFERQLPIPGAVLLRAVYKGETVGADWYFVQAGVAYSHLAAFAPAGYGLGAAYALMWSAIHDLRGEARWMDLGGSAGVTEGARDGLARFKRGWSTGTRTAYFCGSILDRRKYERLAEAKGREGTPYFPAYREGEFR